MLVENPILNSPFEEPEQYWDFRQGQPVLAQGRRPAGYYLRPRLRGEQASLLEEEFVPLEIVNLIRERVRGWQSRGYPGVTAQTRQLLQHWSDPDRERCLFFRQREAAETPIWLIEASPAERQGIDIARDEILVRYASKTATGSGKTVVMGMVIAWQVLNKLANPQDRRFSDAVLIVCPNLTIRERLQVLLPWKDRNFYVQLNLVPPGLLPRLPVHDHIAAVKVLSDLENRDGEVVAFKIDTKLLKEAEAAVEGETREQTVERLRQVFDTIGKLERMAEVIAYARNDHLDFTIPYEFQGTRHEYRPDYLVKLKKGDGRPVTLILEVKGFETEQDRAKEVAAADIA